MKPMQMVRKASKGSLFIFDHGLGDFVNFLPVFEEFKRQSGVNVHLASTAKRQFKDLCSSVIYIDDEADLRRRYGYTYRLAYPEPKTALVPVEFNKNHSKPYICAYHELGMNHFVWQPKVLPNPSFDKDSKRVGVHFFGHTSIAVKCCPKDACEKIWDEIKKAGYEPFEIHMRPQFRKEYTGCTDESDYFKYATEDNSLRFREPSLKEMALEMGKCRFFFGVDSGPLYLAAAVLGADNIAGIQKDKFVGNYLPTHINSIPSNNYVEGSVTKVLEELEKGRKLA